MYLAVVSDTLLSWLPAIVAACYQWLAAICDWLLSMAGCYQWLPSVSVGRWLAAVSASMLSMTNSRDFA